MPGATPNQGFVYPILGDPPAQLAATWATLAAQLDAKASAYDADSARVVANNFVKLSATNASDSQISGGPVLTTIEVARGVAVDLTTYNGLILPPAVWMIGGSALFIPFSAGNTMEVQPVLAASPSTGTAPFPSGFAFDLMIRDPLGQPAGSLADGLTTGMGFAEVVYMQNALTTVKLGTTTLTGRTIAYADLWAFQIGEI